MRKTYLIFTFLAIQIFINNNVFSQTLEADNSLIPVQEKDGYLWGYINDKGELIISFQFERAQLFKEGLAAVKSRSSGCNCGCWGYINNSGEYVIQPKFRMAKDFSENLAAVKLCTDKFNHISGKWGYINKAGDIIHGPFNFDYVFNFSNGLARVISRSEKNDVNTKTGYINTKGELQIPTQYKHAEDFSEGLASVSIDGIHEGYIDTKGNIVIPTVYESAGKFSEGLAAVSIDTFAGETFMFIDKNNNIIIDSKIILEEYKKVITLSPSFIIKCDRFTKAMEFTEGLAAVNIGGGGIGDRGENWGYINKSGSFIIEPKYISALPFSEGKAFVGFYSEKQGGYTRNVCGFIDKNDQIVIEPQFHNCFHCGFKSGPFVNGIACIEIGDKLYYIDENGDVIWTNFESKSQDVIKISKLRAADDSCGSEMNLKVVNQDIETNITTDPRDGKKYKIVKIGNQTWMVENLNYNTRSGSWCYNDSSSNCGKYGRLYNWQTANSVCPNGWHLPSDSEWSQLVNHLGFYSAGSKLLSTELSESSNEAASKSSGFSALLGGGRHSNGNFHNLGEWAIFWSSTEYSKHFAWGRNLYYGTKRMYPGHYYEENGRSVRCVRD